MFEKEKKEILDAALEIKKCNLISLSGGNVSMRAGENLFLVTPSGMIYEEMTADDVVVIDRDCRVVEGTRKPSSDSPALVYMFEHMPHINALIHTHQPYATTAGFESVCEAMYLLPDSRRIRSRNSWSLLLMPMGLRLT